MNYRGFYAIGMLILAMTGMYGCSEDFKVAAPYKDVTLVYGLLNMDDTAHYIRIQKAFLDDQKDVFSMASVADSSFFQNLNVTMRELAGGVVMNNIPLHRVNLVNEGYVKDSGTFFRTPNYAYKFKHALDPNMRYRLVIQHAEGNVDSAEIDIISSKDMKLVIPDTNNFFLKFDKTIPVSNPSFSYTILFNVPATARYMEVVVRFHWEEKNMQTGEEKRHSSDFLITAQAVENPGATYQRATKSNISFYSFLREAMNTAPAHIERYMDSSDIIIYAGGEDFLNYINTVQVQSNGLTADQLKPNYTNIHGKDVYGIFTSRGVYIQKRVPFDQATLDSLKVNEITKDINIKGMTPH